MKCLCRESEANAFGIEAALQFEVQFLKALQVFCVVHQFDPVLARQPVSTRVAAVSVLFEEESVAGESAARSDKGVTARRDSITVDDQALSSFG